MSLNSEAEDVQGPGGFAHGLLIYLVGLLVAVPLFLILYPYVPELIIPVGQGYRVDHILTFVLVLVNAAGLFVRRRPVFVPEARTPSSTGSCRTMRSSLRQTSPA